MSRFFHRPKRPRHREVSTTRRAWLSLLLYTGFAAGLIHMAVPMAVSVASIRDIRQVNAGALGSILFIVVTVVVMLAVLRMIQRVFYASQLAAAAARTSGEITGKWISEGGDTRDFCVSYQYHYDQEAYACLNKSEYALLKIGDQISVFYLPHALHVSRIDRKAPPFQK